MILTCPKCSARYHVGADQVPVSGRNVRCVKCGHIWHQMPPADENAAAQAPADSLRAHMAAHAPMGAIHSEALDSSVWEKAMLAVGWAGLVLIIGLIGWAGYTYRDVVMHDWPQSASVYAAMGMVQDHKGLELYLDPMQTESVSGHEEMVFRGKVENTTKQVMVVPQLRAHFLDSDNQEVARWSVEAGALTLKPGEATRFVTRYHNPPATARHFEIRFAARDY